ncbi:MAG: FAD-dependent oxidoreductase [Alphaproteobacteria bacterium]
MKIGIIGAGWYGCHLASVLRQRGHEITIFEASDGVLNRASTLNQARLHAGYHYPRCFRTRSETAQCFTRFLATYPQFTKPIAENVYAVSDANSMMDFWTYTQTMRALNLKFVEANPLKYHLANVEGCMTTEERSLNFPVAQEYFRATLAASLRLDHAVKEVKELGNRVQIDGEIFDLAINCTWCALNTYSGPHTLFFEPTTLFYYEATEPFFGALTTMDGACFSIYPFADNVYTLSHVGLTPRGQFNTFAEADHINNALTATFIHDIRERMVSEVLREFPSFRDRFQFVGVQRSVKTKFVNARASRRTIVARYGNVVTVLSGKIDTIFVAEDAILEMLHPEEMDARRAQQQAVA